MDEFRILEVRLEEGEVVGPQGFVGGGGYCLEELRTMCKGPAKGLACRGIGK